MNISDRENLQKALDICVDLNGYICDMSKYNIVYYTKEGFCAATSLIETAIKTKDIRLFADVFDKTRQLVASAGRLDEKTRREIIKQKDVFDRLVVKKLSQHPSFTIKVMIPSIERVK